MRDAVDEGIWLAAFMHYDLGYLIGLSPSVCTANAPARATRSARSCGLMFVLTWHPAQLLLQLCPIAATPKALALQQSDLVHDLPNLRRIGIHHGWG